MRVTWPAIRMLSTAGPARLAWLRRPGGSGGLAGLHAFADLALDALLGRDVVAPAGLVELVGQVLLGDVVALELVRELVADADAVLLHPAVAGGAQVVGDGQRASSSTSAMAAQYAWPTALLLGVVLM